MPPPRLVRRHRRRRRRTRRGRARRQARRAHHHACAIGSISSSAVPPRVGVVVCILVVLSSLARHRARLSFPKPHAASEPRARYRRNGPTRCSTSARAPSISARSPRTPATISSSLDRAGDRVAPHDVAQRGEQHLAGGAQVAADDHALGVDACCIGSRPPPRSPGPASPSRRRAAAIPVVAELEQAARGDLLAAARRSAARDRPRRGERLEAAAVPAPAHRTRPRRRRCGRSRPRCRRPRGGGGRRRSSPAPIPVETLM